MFNQTVLTHSTPSGKNGYPTPQTHQPPAQPEKTPRPQPILAESNQLDVMRPTLVVLLGGTGQLIGANLKAALIQRFGLDAWQGKIRLVGFDTTEEPVAASSPLGPVQLEAGAEFFNIGRVPIPNIIRNLDKLDAIRERLGSVINSLPGGSLRTGARQHRPLGLLALLWHYNTVVTQLHKAIWRLAGRDMQGQTAVSEQQGINVFICGSLVGGTCSGTILDVAALIRSLFSDLGSQEEFCHITGVGVLPQAFPNVPGQNLYPNAGAALDELNHAMTQGGFHARYPDGRIVDIPDALFNLFYILDGVDERGQTWAGIHQVTAMAAQGIFLQMASQLGQKGENAFDNVDTILANLTNDGHGTFLASFGLGYLEFDAPAVAQLCSRWHLHQLIRDTWLCPATDATTQATAQAKLQIAASAQITPKLLHDPHTNGELYLDLHIPSWLLDKQPDEMAAEATRYVREYSQVRVNENLLGQIHLNGRFLSETMQATWQQWVNQQLFTPDNSLPTIQATLHHAEAQLRQWREAAHRQLADLEKGHEQQVIALTQRETAVSQAAASLPIGRKARLRKAIEAYFLIATQQIETERQQGVLRAQQAVWSDLAATLQQMSHTLQMLHDRLTAIAQQQSSHAQTMLKQLQSSGVARHSLADEPFIRQLYAQYLPDQINLQTGDGETTSPSLELAHWSTSKLSDWLLTAVSAPFTPIHQLTIEAIIARRSHEMTPQARRQQLFQLATPSWSINPARLPEGGHHLVRLQVLGVPDERHTHYKDETMRVSTHDPHRLIALTVVAGVPQTALKQYDLYRRALDHARGQYPIHIHPSFVADASQVKLSFALGSIFGLITSQGTYFYYQPTDPLQNQRRLGNGLINAIQGLATENGLANEIIERIDGKIAQLGLQQAIAVLHDYYHTAPQGRSQLDETTRELKQLVRAYSDELRQINDLSRRN